MKRYKYLNRILKTLFFAVLFCVVFEACAEGDIIYASAPLGETGKTSGSVLYAGYDSIPDKTFYVGARFHLDYSAEVTAIGGHFYFSTSSLGDLFGAIVELDGPDATPPEIPFDSSDVIASTVFVPNNPSTDYRVGLAVSLEPGDYAVIFGSNALGASDGRMAAVICPPYSETVDDIITGNDVDSWWPWPDSNVRFVVEGTVDIPEPGTILLFGLGAMVLRKKR